MIMNQESFWRSQTWVPVAARKESRDLASSSAAQAVLAGQPNIFRRQDHAITQRNSAIPLTRQPDGMQAWKIVMPTTKVTPELRAHDGYEWIYVLSGHMRLVLGDRDWIFGPGEIAEFDTRKPLVRQHRQRARRDPQHLRPIRRTNDRPNDTRRPNLGPGQDRTLYPVARTQRRAGSEMHHDEGSPSERCIVGIEEYR
jgi:quercetin dioxygenase-like cupin family protein